MRKLLVFLGILAVLASGGYYGYLFLEKDKNADQLADLDGRLTVLNEESLIYKNEQVSQAVKSKQTVEDLQLDLVLWSEIVEEIEDVIPTDSGDKLVNVLSYSGSSNNSITLNFKTNPGRANPYFDVSDVIEAFNQSDKFSINFVPSITKGFDDEGKELLSFLMNSQYLPDGKVEDSNASEEPDGSENLESSDTPENSETSEISEDLTPLSR